MNNGGCAAFGVVLGGPLLFVVVGFVGKLLGV